MINRRSAFVLAGGVMASVATWKCSMAGSVQMSNSSQMPVTLEINNATWQFVSDTVMGGVSRGSTVHESIAGRNALRMRGIVRLENNGGFIQVALDLRPDGSPVDASAFSGIEIDVIGNSETYNLHLRTTDLTRPWQSYRQSFEAGTNWETHRLPFADFEAYRTDADLDVTKLRRIGIVAIGRPFKADIAVGGIRFYK
ncbi:MAG: CIA30 family protein [Hyphomicrobiaceae bacterium]